MPQQRSAAAFGGGPFAGRDVSALFDRSPLARRPECGSANRPANVAIASGAIARVAITQVASASVAIGCGPLSAPIIAAQVIPHTQRSAPGRAVTLAVGDLDRAITRVAAGTLDFAIDCMGVAAVPAALPASLAARTIGSVASLLFVRAGHPLTAAPLAPGALAGWALALPEAWPAVDRWFLKYAGAAADVAMRCNDFALIGAAVAASDLIGCASAAILADLQRGHDLVPLIALRPDVRHHIRCIVPRGGPRSAAAAALLGEIERAFSAH